MGYIPRVRELVSRHLPFFIAVSAAALLLRLLFLLHFPGVVTDSFVYGDIAKNWLQHGIYGLSGPDEISPTYIRLPGYPAFLALVWAVVGVEHYRAVLIAQTLIDVVTCFLCADLARRELGSGAARISFAAAAFCPFLANYAGAALTETLEVFATAAALNFASRGLTGGKLRDWAACGVASAGAILLRPDGTLLVFAILAYLGAQLLWPRISAKSRGRQKLLAAALVVGLVSTSPLIPWTLRNWHVFHRFQPLAPRYANEENEFVPVGFNRWVKTWIADYTSVEEIYWAVPGSPIEGEKLPRRAFDTPQQRTLTLELIADYNQLLHVSPELDRRFLALAEERIASHPLRYYAVLPGLRILDMWMRPRTEMLPADSRWWEFDDEPRWSALTLSLGIVNLLYVLVAVVGWIKRRKQLNLALLLLFVVLRSAFLGTLENPEPRYTLEMYPVVIVFLAAALTKTAPSTQRSTVDASPEENPTCETGFEHVRRETQWRDDSR
jgi:dolichyl-phosphate-mannose-protein mannosyltransferase